MVFPMLFSLGYPLLNVLGDRVYVYIYGFPDHQTS